jgi:hypothetical protein
VRLRRRLARVGLALRFQSHVGYSLEVCDEDASAPEPIGVEAAR